MKPWRVHQVTLSWLPPQEMPGTENPNHGTESQILAQTHGLLTAHIVIQKSPLYPLNSSV